MPQLKAMAQAAAVSTALTSDLYTWSFPGAPVRIQLHLDAAQRLLAEISKSASETPQYECGGVLIGRASSPQQIEITDFLPIIPADTNEKFVLPPSHWDRIAYVKSALTAKPSADGLEEVVGYYRSHLRKNLNLSEEDLALFQSQFSRPTDVCLLIKPLADGSSTAGFFFWDNGAVESGFSFNEFPFDPERLRLEAMEQRIAALQPRREPEPEVVPEKTNNLIPMPALPQKPAKRNGWLVPVMALVTLAGGLGLGYAVWGRAKTTWTQQADTNSSPQLALRVQTQDSDLRIAWNRNAPILKGENVRGALTILDGDTKREIELGPDDLVNTGSIIYTPLTSKVHFRLDIKSTSQTTTESTLALKGSGSTPPPVSVPAPKTTVPQVLTPKTTLEADPEEEVSTSAVTETKPFAPPDPERHLIEQRNKTLEDEPPPVTTSHQQPVSAPWSVSFKVAPPPVPRQVPTDPSPLTTSLTPAPTPAPVYIMPKAIREVRPTVPTAVRPLVTKDGEVKIKVYIDATGKVKRAEPLESTAPLLIGNAMSAALLWRFEPARRNNEPVESSTVLIFQFRANRR